MREFEIMRGGGRALLVLLFGFAGQGAAQASPHRMSLTVHPADFERYTAAQASPRATKEGAAEREARIQMLFDARSATVQVDEGPAVPLAEMHARGQSSANARRRSFEIHLERNAIEVGELAAQKLLLLSMQADEGYVSTVLGFRVLALAGLPVPRFSYVELFLNGVSQGLYLALERAVDVTRRDLDAVYVARRRYFDWLEVKKYEARATEISEAAFTRTLGELFALRRRLEGEALYVAWSRAMDIDRYMLWLGMNSLLRNGDFSDEVYFYSRSTDADAHPYYEIFPWDMDDLFKERMHLAPLNWLLSGGDDDTLLFGFESGLDRAINGDRLLYRRFEEVLRRALTESVTDQAIDQVIDATRRDVLPYLDRPAVRANARKDWINRKGLDRSSVLQLLEDRRRMLKARRASFLARIGARAR